MKMNKIWAALFVATAFGFVSCTDTDAQYTLSLIHISEPTRPY